MLFTVLWWISALVLGCGFVVTGLMVGEFVIRWWRERGSDDVRE